ncbi:MAG: anti-sigma factor [Burkholderiales bacterium]
MDYSRPELADRLAAEYVSGLLRGPARRRFEKLLPAHPALRNAVRAWHDRLMPLTAEIAPEPPSAAVWQRIEAKIHGATAAPAPSVGWWRQLAFWRAFSAVGAAATLSLAALLATPGPAQPPIVVVLSATGPAPASGVVPASFVASISGDGRAIVTRPLVNVALQPGRVLELWAAAGSGAPRSMGLISADGASVVRKASMPPGTDHLAVSLEPPGGSPTGAPTGPVLYVGKLVL